MNSDELLASIKDLPAIDLRLMEVCGTHTMAIAKFGIKQQLPKNIRLISGPGCPVCVTPQEIIDAILELSEKDNIIIATYGDMVRVPGSTRGDNLARRRAGGAGVEIVYSAFDAIKLAKERPNHEIVFLGVGFETTAPGTAAAIVAAAEEEVHNFSVFPILRLIEPAMRALIGTEDFKMDGFLCPGHVAVIIGANGFEFLPRDYGLPAVISGFDYSDIMLSVFLLAKMCEAGRAELINEYRKTVSAEGNTLAIQMMERVFKPKASTWRGLGKIENSGLAIRPEFEAFDTIKKFNVNIDRKSQYTACKCGEIITGRTEPRDCPFFGTVCVPEEPVGPCMVSSEGACAAAYKYQDIK